MAQTCNPIWAAARNGPNFGGKEKITSDIEAALDQAFAVVFKCPVRPVMRKPDPEKWLGGSNSVL